MKSIISAVFLPLLLFCCACVTNAKENRELIEQWRIYSDSETSEPYLTAALYSFDGEDAALGIRCNQQRTELYFMFSDRLPARLNSAFVFKADGIELQGGQWLRASGENGAFSLKPAALIKRLADKKRLILTYKTARGEHKVAGFYLAGIGQLRNRMASVCQINPTS